jgi:pSer/pThr/pTyr-binding forkhead associated (FHA) protein
MVVKMSIKCPQCGNDNPPDSLFCENCGFKLPAAPAPVTPPPPPVAPPPTPTPTPAPPSVMYSLNFKTGAFDVSETTRSFGRQDFAKHIPESDHKYISRKHFTIFKEDDKFFIQDEGSSNGTKLNDEEIKGAGKKELKDNDKILVADTVELQFNVKK